MQQIAKIELPTIYWFGLLPLCSARRYTIEEFMKRLSRMLVRLEFSI